MNIQNNELMKLADMLDSVGKYDFASKVDSMLVKLADRSDTGQKEWSDGMHRTIDLPPRAVISYTDGWCLVRDNLIWVFVPDAQKLHYDNHYTSRLMSKFESVKVADKLKKKILEIIHDISEDSSSVRRRGRKRRNDLEELDKGIFELDGHINALFANSLEVEGFMDLLESLAARGIVGPAVEHWWNWCNAYISATINLQDLITPNPKAT